MKVKPIISNIGHSTKSRYLKISDRTKIAYKQLKETAKRPSPKEFPKIGFLIGIITPLPFASAIGWGLGKIAQIITKKFIP